ncbi:MAG: PilN domain-containing protein [Phycisphaerae bacterium]
MKSKDCLVGFELSGDRIRMAAITGTSADSRSGGARRLQWAEIAIPEADARAPARLPPVSRLVPLFKATLARLGIGGGQAAVAVGGSRLVLRYFVGADDLVRTELQQATERSISYVHFGLGDRVVGEHLYRLGDGRTHALLGVSAATMIDPLVKTVEQVGLRVKVIEPALVALTRVASVTGQLNGKVVLLVLVDTSGIDIGVVSDGHVLVSRRPLPAPGLGSESQARERAATLTRELEKTSRHYLRAFGASEEVRQIIMCGPEDLLRPHIEALEGSPDFQAGLLRIGEAVSTALAVPSDDLAVKEAHAVALGAAAGLTSECSKVVGPNLTSEPEVQRRPMVGTLFRTVLWPTLAALGIWGAVYFAQGHLASALAQLRIEADRPSPVETTYRELQMQVIQTEQRAVRLGELVQNFQDRSWKGLLETIRVCVPDRLWLASVRVTAERQLTIEGAAYDEALVYQFRKDLEGAPLFDSVTITSTTSSQDGNAVVTEFSLECTVISGLPAPDVSST